MTEITGSWYSENGVLKKTGTLNTDKFASGIVLYEVLRIQNGVALFLEDHFNRLSESVRLSELPAWVKIEQIRKWLRDLVNSTGITNGNVKIIAWYEKANADSPVYAFFIPHSYPTVDMYKSGVETDFYKAIRENPNVKKLHPGLISQISAFITEKEIYDALLVDENDYLTEGSRTNFFLIKNEELLTAPGDRVLKGITREKIFDLCKRLSVPVRETLIKTHEVGTFNAAFFSGTSPKILPVCKISGYTFDVKNPLMLKLSKAYEDLIQDYINRY